HTFLAYFQCTSRSRSTMRTTIDIPDELMTEAIECSGQRSKRGAVCWALQEAVRQKYIGELVRRDFPKIEFDMTHEEYKAREKRLWRKRRRELEAMWNAPRKRKRA